jgi:hypothetical protein
MVKKQKKDIRKSLVSKRYNEPYGRARKINASTAYETCSEQLSPFGGLLGLIKLLDLFDFRKYFDETYIAPSRKTKLGDYAMVLGIVMLMFIGFNRIWHFIYLRLESMLCGIFRVSKLPAASTYWRYLDSLGINQAKSFLRIMSRLREEAWKQCGIKYSRIAIDIDTTVETIYGGQEGGRVGHNPRNRGKKDTVRCFALLSRRGNTFMGNYVKGKQ